MRKVIFCILWLCVLKASAAVYQWRGPDGQIHYGDRPVPGANTLSLKPGFSYYRVGHIFDGDTVELVDGRRVRLLNINTPEVETPRKRGELGGEEAKRRLQDLLEDRRIRLVYDVERRDKYDRTLAHLFTEDGVHINRLLVEEGWAIANIHPPNLKYADKILAAQAEAEQAGRGIWGMDDYAPQPIETLRRKRLYGWHRLVGEVLQIKAMRKYVRLLFAADLYVVIPKTNLKLFPDFDAYVGHRVEVRGWPGRRGRSHSILVRHPDALRILDPAP
ncbi:thermonuclease family protein [Methylohalobius crimeensis]|uniref:thermonuclease family protein n=1 Tax=Methylohalobius crimeensis TaxID=244365 RepID=UPI0003B62AC2|nr:thermonuclease family protein [Methylohalobius crimeensis]